jgi:inosine/xanthosine triphosphate pyrophosphatase family protein
MDKIERHLLSSPSNLGETEEISISFIEELLDITSYDIALDTLNVLGSDSGLSFKKGT